MFSYKRGFLRTLEIFLALSILVFFLYSLENNNYENQNFKDFILNEYGNDIYEIEKSCYLLEKNCSFSYDQYNINSEGTYCIIKTIILLNETKEIKVCFN